MPQEEQIFQNSMKMATDKILNDPETCMYGGGRPSKRRATDTYDINCGLCEEWAEDVRQIYYKTTGKDEVESVSPMNITGDEDDECSHIFVRFNGKFYDAECTEGVNDWTKLPLIINHLKKNMPASTEKQANAAKLAGAVKAGEFSTSKAVPAVKSMSKSKLKHFMKVKESMTLEQKKRVLKALQSLKEQSGNIGGTTDIVNADNLRVNEDEYTTRVQPERNAVAKTFDTEADFDSYVNQRRGIEMTSKELQSILGFHKVKPTHQDKFSVEFESTDDFGKNSTTIIKKLRDGNQFCWTAFSKHEDAEEEGKPKSSENPSLNELTPTPSAKSIPSGTPPVKSSQPKKPAPVSTNPQPNPQASSTKSNGNEEVTVYDPIRITKSTTFIDDGSNILGDFLLKLDI